MNAPASVQGEEFGPGVVVKEVLKHQVEFPGANGGLGKDACPEAAGSGAGEREHGNDPVSAVAGKLDASPLDQLRPFRCKLIGKAVLDAVDQGRSGGVYEFIGHIHWKLELRWIRHSPSAPESTSASNDGGAK